MSSVTLQPSKHSLGCSVKKIPVLFCFTGSLSTNTTKLSLRRTVYPAKPLWKNTAVDSNAAFLSHDHQENQMGDRALLHQSPCTAKRQQLLVRVSCRGRAAKFLSLSCDWHSTHCQRSQSLAGLHLFHLARWKLEVSGILYVKRKNKLETFWKNADLDDRKSLSQMGKIFKTTINRSPERVRFWHKVFAACWPVHMQDKNGARQKCLLSDKFFRNAFVASLASLPNEEDALKLFCGWQNE